MPSYENGSYNTGSTSAMSKGYIDSGDSSARDMKLMKDAFYQSSYPQNSSYWMQAALDMRFKVGDQSLYSLVYGNQNSQYQKFFFNLIRRHINMICGYQRKNRKSTVTLPVHENDDSLSDDYNAVIKYCEDRDGFQEYISQAFEGSVSTGMTLMHMYPDYTYDPISGDLFTDYVAYNNFLIDPYFRKMDLSDCNGIWRRRWVTPQIAKTMLPGYAEEIDRMKTGGMRDGRFPLQAELQNLANSNLFTYDEFYYRTTRTAKIILDPKTGEAAEWEDDEEDGEDSEELFEMTMRQQPWLIVKKTQVPTVKLSIALGDHEVYNGKNLLGIDDYPMVPSICYHEPDMQAYAWRCMGVIRNLRDPQFLYNMRKVIELQLLQSQINSGWIYPVDAVTDPKAFRQSSGGDGFLIPLKAGRLPQEIQRIEPVAIPQSLMELSASLAEDITKISGVNEELLGAATDDKSGILSMLRQGAGLVTLQTIFDKLDYTQRLYGNIRLKAIRKNFSKGKIRNILGHDPDPRFFTSHSQKYSIAVEEGNYSATQRQTELQQLLHFREIGIPVANKSIMRAAIITDKKRLMSEMEEEQQAQQQQEQAQAQQQAQKDQSDMMAAFAKSKADLARAKESEASAMSKMASIEQTHAKAEHEMAESDLNLVKMMLELETMDLDQIGRSWEIAQSIKGANQAQSNQQQNQNLAGV